jgi:lactoylglutathione lyase
MILEHVAIWTDDVEKLKNFYVKYFDAVPNNKYINPSKGFESYFLSFKSGARLEIMKKKGVPQNLNDTVHQQHRGIIHLAFGVDTIAEVDAKAKELAAEGIPILSGPRKTGDGYYEFETLDPDNNRLEVATAWQD